MFAKRTLLLAAMMVVALFTFVEVEPAAAVPPISCLSCNCNLPCSTFCIDLDPDDPITCGQWGVCQGSSGCGCGCGSYVVGTSGNDTLYGNTGSNCIYGLEGDDTIYADQGHDKLYGDEGADSLYGNAGNDCIYGGPQNDYLNGSTGYDLLNGQGGSDACVNGEIVQYCES